MKRSVLVVITGVLLPLAVQAADAPQSFPLNTPPAIDAASYVLMDYTTGQVLAQANADQRRNPASLTKLMTGLVIDHALDQHKIGLDDVVAVGKDAWAQGNPVFKGSSLMFLKPGDRVTVRDLSRGIIIDSGNDACVAMADYVAGSQAAFVKLMNEKSAQLGLQNTHFETVHGLDAPGQFTTAGDLAVISRAIIMSEPAEYHMYSEKSLTWNGITQQNRNGLLWDKNLRVDGLKTGHTESAGFNIIASATEGDRRLIAVVMGGKSPKGREEQARKLLTWGLRDFDTVHLFSAGQNLGQEKVWYGDRHEVTVGSAQDQYFSLPKSEAAKLKAQYVINTPRLDAPLAQGQAIGEIRISDNGKVLKTLPLVALQPVNQGGMFSRLMDYVKLKI
ncbi:serine-type D-Ala-D-Ala carboxypeptidase DacD [Serratia proteamaculans]|uniref:serine-type D-Ala-D-Ala carboxypeptidase DacD n=1 Tax=Serratia proteamaculans TaxID=28151 RepID=UPI000D9CA237|nr:serine-type D-Ala-D-Ala carboxypeptidase DacD [Serratia proteamaculans]SPZ53826.1 D-alanyl-D-alanine carboxypeptidase dacD precursor [Serratia quinivorans]NWA71438.1 serine-type D-Ala-D-Ala carboxypeptidase DacD [Serratia proteamaculans]CAI0756209.1 D-alanyl-D-alanine carboxypeptidase dacD precursor [Serratia proteamaculans]CAI0786543.1 D-alanyl-D-alanine carboxypeptidase dacD precursor [Serratia proteamaculans]CAI0786735.1 D-alanyl-D-alanine carboxypeptidase dacD precursor [Serratia protea